MRKILLPTDGSEYSVRALHYLLDRLKKDADGADIDVLHVQLPLPEALPETADPGLFARVRDDEAEAATAWAHDLLQQSGLHHRIEIETGDPAQRITQYAKAHDCDEIVMGTRGLGTLKGLVLGSVAQKVMHLTDRPVLLVK
jgi:nucleotide-binding universal stress UspA family protein